MTAALALPAGAFNIAAVTLLALVLVAIAGVLPLGPAALVVLATATGVVALAAPRFAFVLIVLSIPFSSWTKVTVGTFDITATDVLVGVLTLAWLLPGFLTRSLRLAPAPTIGAGLVLLCAMLLSTLTAHDLPSALKEVIKLAEVLVVALFVASTVRSTADVRFVLFVSLGAAVSESLVGIHQFVTGSGPETFQIGPFVRAYGDFAQPNAFAGYLALILPFALALSLLRSSDRWPGLAASAVIGMAVLASLSRGAWVGLGLAISLMALIWGPGTRLGLVGASGILGIALVFGVAGVLPAVITERVTVVFENFLVFDVRELETNPTNFPLVERLAHWYAAWGMFEAFPLAGVGPGNYDAAYEDFQLQGWPESLGHAHNYYLNTLAELGVVGFLAFATFMATIFARAAHAVHRAPQLAPIFRAAAVGALGSAVTIAAHNAFDNMLVHGIGVQLGIVIGLLEVVASSPDSSPSPSPGVDRDIAFAHRD